jgi:hypothetical protein
MWDLIRCFFFNVSWQTGWRSWTDTICTCSGFDVCSFWNFWLESFSHIEAGKVPPAFLTRSKKSFRRKLLCIQLYHKFIIQNLHWKTWIKSPNKFFHYSLIIYAYFTSYSFISLFSCVIWMRHFIKQTIDLFSMIII